MREFVLVTFLDGCVEDGGAYIHKRNMLRALCLLKSEALRIIIICSDHEGVSLVNEMGLTGVLRKTGRLRRFCNRLFAVRWLRNLFGHRLAELPFGLDYLLRRLRADLVLFSGADIRVLQLLTHNYIVQYWTCVIWSNRNSPKSLNSVNSRGASTSTARFAERQR